MTRRRQELLRRWWPVYLLTLLLFAALLPSMIHGVCAFADWACCGVGDQLAWLEYQATVRTMERGYPF